jgi:hypothetical protein
MECYCECEKGAIKIKLISKPEVLVVASDFFKHRFKKKTPEPK